MQTIEFHFDFGSPNAYLAHLVVPQIEARANVQIQYVPVLLGGLFKATNNASPMVTEKDILNKREYRQMETARFLRDWNVPAQVANPHFPVNTLQIMRGATYALRAGILTPYVEAMFTSMWRKAKKMDDLDVIQSELTAAQLPVDEILAGIAQAETKQTLIDNTQASVARGNFGSPTFFVGEQMFFGKNTCKDVEAEIERLIAER
jgi:2-hydroxychromene-2-carboxylate isomerase